jgi:hypothetical protein
VCIYMQTHVRFVLISMGAMLVRRPGDFTCFFSCRVDRCVGFVCRDLLFPCLSSCPGWVPLPRYFSLLVLRIRKSVIPRARFTPLLQSCVILFRKEWNQLQAFLCDRACLCLFASFVY